MDVDGVVGKRSFIIPLKGHGGVGHGQASVRALMPHMGREGAWRFTYRNQLTKMNV
jgi:hypothetical protein